MSSNNTKRINDLDKYKSSKEYRIVHLLSNDHPEFRDDTPPLEGLQIEIGGESRSNFGKRLHAYKELHKVFIYRFILYLIDEIKIVKKKKIYLKTEFGKRVNRANNFLMDYEMRTLIAEKKSAVYEIRIEKFKHNATIYHDLEIKAKDLIGEMETELESEVLAFKSRRDELEQRLIEKEELANNRVNEIEGRLAATRLEALAFKSRGRIRATAHRKRGTG